MTDNASVGTSTSFLTLNKNQAILKKLVISDSRVSGSAMSMEYFYIPFVRLNQVGYLRKREKYIRVH